MRGTPPRGARRGFFLCDINVTYVVLLFWFDFADDADELVEVGVDLLEYGVEFGFAVLHPFVGLDGHVECVEDGGDLFFGKHFVFSGCAVLHVLDFASRCCCCQVFY